MKYKLYAAVSFLIILVAIGVILFVTRAEDVERYHQHLEEEELPLMEINTGGVPIPGKPIDGNVANLTLSEDGSSEIICDLKIDGVQSDAYINIRGRSSRLFDKVGYNLKLVDETGENNPQSIAGMDAHHEWALHGPYLDKTMLRNYMWYNVAGEFMDYSPNVRFCELKLNGEYLGIYVIVESITAGDNGARIQLAVDKKDNSFTGYLLRLDIGSNTPIKNIETFSQYTYRFANKVDIVYPGAKNLTPEIAEGIRQDFSDFEKSLYSFDYDNEKHGYASMIDVDSFVDYFIINEFTLNYDAGGLSTYVYKDIDGKYRMCIWDFNSANDNYQETTFTGEGFALQYIVWYTMLMKDEVFVERIIERYEELRKTYLSEEYLMNYIDETIDFLGPAVDRNFEKWGYTFAEEHQLLNPKERNLHSYEEAVEQLKENIKARGKWMDENIHTLRQYAAESKVKKYNEHTD